MHIITIMNYYNRNAILMCKSWIYLAKRFNPTTRITIFHVDDISEIQTFSLRYSSIRFIKIPKKLLQKRLTRGFIHHPVQELQLAVWKKLESMHLTKFIYVDADALIVDSLRDWWNIIDEKPYIAIGERPIGSHIIYNAGVFSYSSKTGFVTCHKLIHQYHMDNNRIKLIAGQQGLINAYFQTIKYDCSHPHIGHEYNCIAKNCSVRTVDDNAIVIYAGKPPFYLKLRRHLKDREEDWWVDWLGWNTTKRVKILHAFGKGFKFWELTECKPLWEYCIKRVS